MAETSLIEWTDATWNPITGCSVVSPGCTNCYAMRLAGTRLRDHPSRRGLTTPSKAGPVWNGEVRFNMDWIEQPLSWSKPKRIFVCAHGDLFHEAVQADWIAWVYGVMIAAHHIRGHTFQVLTKRSARARELLNTDAFWDDANDYASDYVMHAVDPLDRKSTDARATCSDYSPRCPPPGIWLGVSAEDQLRLDERLPDLLWTPAARRFLSAEPLLGELDLSSPYTSELFSAKMREARLSLPTPWQDRFGDWHGADLPAILPGLHQVIAGGEGGPNARPLHPDWPRDLNRQCAEAGVAFFFKQWGEWAPECPDGFSGRSVMLQTPRPDWGGCVYRVGKKAAGRLLDGVEHNNMPA